MYVKSLIHPYEVINQGTLVSLWYDESPLQSRDVILSYFSLFNIANFIIKMVILDFFLQNFFPILLTILLPKIYCKRYIKSKASPNGIQLLSYLSGFLERNTESCLMKSFMIFKPSLQSWDFLIPVFTRSDPAELFLWWIIFGKCCL